MVTWFKNGLIQLSPECVTSPRVGESSWGTESWQQQVCSHKQLPLAGNPETCHYKLVQQKLQIFWFPLLSWGQVHSCSSWHFTAHELKEKSESCQHLEIRASVSGSVETWEKNSRKPNTWWLFSTRCKPVLLQIFDLLGELVVWGNGALLAELGGAWWKTNHKSNVRVWGSLWTCAEGWSYVALLQMIRGGQRGSKRLATCFLVPCSLWKWMWLSHVHLNLMPRWEMVSLSLQGLDAVSPYLVEKLIDKCCVGSLSCHWALLVFRVLLQAPQFSH